MNLAQIRKHYGVPARKGMRVRVVHPTRPPITVTIVGAVTGALVVEYDKPWSQGFHGRAQWGRPQFLQYLDAEGRVIYDGCTPLFPQDKDGQFELFSKEARHD